MVKVYGIKNCSSVKKAINYFKIHNINYELVDFKTTPIDKDILNRWLEKVTLNELFNKRSTTYRELKLKELDLDDNSIKEWLIKENKLIKRPVIEFKNEVIVGYNESYYSTLLK